MAQTESAVFLIQVDFTQDDDVRRCSAIRKAVKMAINPQIDATLGGVTLQRVSLYDSESGKHYFDWGDGD